MAPRVRQSLVAIALLLATASLVGGAVRQAPSGGVSAVPADFAQDPLLYVLELRSGEALAHCEAVLNDPGAPPALRRQVLITLATIRLGQNRNGQAREALLQMLEGDPTGDLDQPQRLPRPIRQLFYHLRDSVCTSQRAALTDAGSLVADIRTLAIGDIEANVVVKTKYDAGNLCRGLAQVLMTDLQGATPLKVVDRQRLEMLLEELKLNKDPALMDPDSRVRMGQLCGAQSYLFGQLMTLDQNKVRLDLRWVNTATSEVLLARGAEGSVATTDDLFKLERKVLLELLLPQMQRILDSTGTPGDLQKQIEKYMDGKRRAMPRNSAYVPALEATGMALAQENAQQYDAAAATWQRVATLNPADSLARVRAQSLGAYQKLRKG